MYCISLHIMRGLTHAQLSFIFVYMGIQEEKRYTLNQESKWDMYQSLHITNYSEAHDMQYAVLYFFSVKK